MTLTELQQHANEGRRLRHLATRWYLVAVVGVLIMLASADPGDHGHILVAVGLAVAGIGVLTLGVYRGVSNSAAALGRNMSAAAACRSANRWDRTTR